YFSLLRPFSELWVASRFATLSRYHLDFRSCNRAFHQDPASRLDGWCGQCDKCCFIDLVLAPYLPPATLSAVFDGDEPLEDPTLVDQFRALLGSDGTVKPFECVGDIEECRTAVRRAAARPDRAGNAFLRSLANEVGTEESVVDRSVCDFLRPIGEHRVPDEFAPEDLLV
ncbi:MAG TPA: hypothetical protein VMB82_06455, partial [Acidimicrobiales bacterium]|nr:hypothetical protein [Acidimicrobiales bacterium]